MSTLRVWGIPCPENTGLSDDDRTLRYRAWFRLYATNQRVRHRLGLHQTPTHYSIAPRCDWCGHRSPEQRAIAERNWRLSTTHPAPTEDAGL